MAFLIVLWAGPLRSQTPPVEVFPLEPGRVWTYAGTVRWTAPGASEVQEKAIEWRMEVLEVLEVLERHPLTAAVLVGHPLDMVWYEEGRTRGRYLLIQVGAGSYYLLGGEDAAKAERRLRDPADPLIGLVQPHQLFLDAPLWPDKRFCGSESLTREDGSYCWVVESVDTVIIDDVSGVLPGVIGTSYRVTLRTIGEHNILDVVPGIGLVGFTFGHHGTVSEVTVRLIDVEPMIPSGSGDGAEEDRVAGDMGYGTLFDPYKLPHSERCDLARRVLLEGEAFALRSWAFNDIGFCKDRGAGETLAQLLRENRTAENYRGELAILVWISAHELTDRALFETALEVATDPSAGERARVEAMRILDGQLDPDCILDYEDLIDPESNRLSDACIIASHPRPKEGVPLPEDASERVENALRGIAEDPSAPLSVRTAANRIRPSPRDD